MAGIVGARLCWRIAVFAIATIGSAGLFPLWLRGQETLPVEKVEFFETRIRPVLVEQCYECHSAAAAKAGSLKGGLSLDNRNALLAGGDSGPAIEPGKPEDSLLISALKYADYEMPPRGKLPDSVIADFEHWVRDGAVDPRIGEAAPVRTAIDLEKGRQFWSFQPLQLEPGELQGDSSIHPVDFFVSQKHAEYGLQMSPPASPRILVRRAWFDLLGIPPQPDELDMWTTRLMESVSEQTSINLSAWSELIDYLLARPEYGERWARHWMDVARFAESFGYEQDYDRPNAYHYRDFLIKAFNADLPYNQFVQWQIAGDQIDPDNPLAWMATGFLGAGVFPTQLTEAEFEKTRYDELDDMVATTGVAFLGLSIGCARCHDHKFDPVTSEDYYRMAATFERTIRSEKLFDLEPDENRRRKVTFDDRLKAARDALADFETNSLPEEFRHWLFSQRSSDDLTGWTVVNGEISSSGQTSFQLLDDGSYLATGAPPDREVVTLLAVAGARIRSLRIEALSDASLPNNGPGRASNGNFALCNLQVALIDEEGRVQQLKLSNPRATHQQNQDTLAVAAAIDDDPVSGWAVDGQIGKNQAAVFDLEPLPSPGPEQRLQVVLTFNHPNPRHAIGRLRVSTTDRTDAIAEVGEAGPNQAVRHALAKLQGLKSGELIKAEVENTPEWQMGLEWFKTRSVTYSSLVGALSELEKGGAGLRLTKVMVSSEGLPHLPHHADERGYPHFYNETHLLRRGEVSQKISRVTPGFPKVLQTSAEVSRGAIEGSRQHLARWLTDVESGAGSLVARVMVNRLWQHHFGRGIVATPNDFGEMGERPWNPALLDWLGSELVENGWQLKPLHKAIMTSQTYMQGSRREGGNRSKIDPDNVYLWHREPRRLEAEAIRDSMLVVSGELDPTMYGPGSLDLSMKRRSIYFFIKRSQLISPMMLFDWPEHLVSIGQRQATTVAPQALMFMNNEQGRAYAESFARRIATEDSAAAVISAYRIAFGRAPNETELGISLEFLTEATKLRPDANEAQSRISALADLCQLLMSMNEFIYVD